MPCPARLGCLPLGTKSEGVDIISRVTAHSGDQVGRHPLRHEARFGHKLAVEEGAPPAEPIGTRDIDSTPTATLISSTPPMIRPPAMLIPSRPAPQKRSICTRSTP